MVKKYKKQVEMDWRGSNGSKWANPPMMEGFLLWNKGVNVWNGRRGRFFIKQKYARAELQKYTKIEGYL